ncbi:DUF4114 domain-containing protein [Calothrix sp. 336/3]|uniref:DUF4114 domain-containing protein n=1 Tax=Calothrix sp. 336/3 TaxID=1337936 RepID=UPI0004E33009|nr:DUF4114 domain-containing protein [Calothrix sp. 336/3]AKG23465.1 hypothetical protein IJ00_21245 [Calothrix sp. 336/3]
MINNTFTKLFTAATILGTFSFVAPAHASILTNANNWSSLTKYEVKDKSTDTSGFKVADYQKYVQRERLEIPDSKLPKIDLTTLKLKVDHNVRVWFINEGAAFKNQLAFSATKGNTEKTGLIFENASCYKTATVNKECQLADDKGVLDPGDYVDIGNISAGSQLDFFLRANAGSNVFSANVATNPDKLDHMVAYQLGKYVLIGFEDLFGAKGATGGKNQNSDRDFNDTVFVVDMGELESIPEPATGAAILGVGALGMLKARRRQK